MGNGSVDQWQCADEEVRKNLPPGVKLVRTLRGHSGTIGRIAWSPDGSMLASPSQDKTIRLWDANTGECLSILKGHKNWISSVAFDPRGPFLASGGLDNSIKLWQLFDGRLVRTIEGNRDKEGHKDKIWCVAFHPHGKTLATASSDNTIKLWDPKSGQLLQKLHGYRDRIWAVAFSSHADYLASASESESSWIWKIAKSDYLINGEHLVFQGVSVGVNHVQFDPRGEMLASACDDGTIKLSELYTGHLIRTLEGHTAKVTNVAFSSDGKILASMGLDDTIRLWNSKTGVCLSVIFDILPNWLMAGLAFHPDLPLLATVGSDYYKEPENVGRVVHIFELDHSLLLGQSNIPSITYTSAKIVLLGDSGVGKTGLGWRLAHGEFKEHSSTHGQQFWLLKQLCKQRLDGTQCEAVLWDLAGQPDYRLIHALFLDDADLALLLFDPTNNDDPLSGVEFWLKQLKVESLSPSGTPTMLIAARTDRGAPRLTQEELDAFCKQRGIKAYIPTSASEGEGIEELVQQMNNLIPWDAKPATVTTETFKRIKDFVLDLKEDSRRVKVILTPEELRCHLEKIDGEWKFSDDEMMTAVGHLENHGYVTKLKTSQGEQRILLAPELLNNLASSFVLEARRNQRGLGSLEEQRLLLGGYKFPELEKLTEAEKDILLDSAAVLFLEHNICFRETDPLNGHAYLVFPELVES